MDNQALHVMTIANSIIGVSIIAMPYCFKQCGIILSIVILIVSSIISRLSCHLLLKSAIMARRRTFEFLAFHAFGPLGKFIVEVGLIGFLLGTCIAFFVVMGDLGPAIVAKMSGTKATDTLRTSILIGLALFCVLPLGLLRNIDSLSSVCTATIGFYFCLVLKIIVQSIPHIFSGDWMDKVELWRPAGFLQCLPIFSMALFCQTQIFEIYQAIPNASLEKMNGLIRLAVNICTGVYIFVGIFGYIAFSSQTFTGNILMSFPTSLMSEIIKIGFVLSVAFSFPLVIFPCRASLYSLLYKRTYSLHDGGADKYIPEGRFKGLTFMIVFVSLVTGIMIPNIELVLGLVGSTIGIMVCILFPAMCFICISTKNTNERILAQLMLFIGVIVMVLGTYANLYAMEEMDTNLITKKVIDHEPAILQIIQNDPALKAIGIPNTSKSPIEQFPNKEVVNQPVIKEVRHEPPQPEEPAEIPAVVDIKQALKDEIDVPEKSADVQDNIGVGKEKLENNKLKDLIVENSVVQPEHNATIKKQLENPVLQEPINSELKESKQHLNIIKNAEVVDVPIYNKVKDNSENQKPVAVGENILDDSLSKILPEKIPIANSEHIQMNINKAKKVEIKNTINGKKADEVAKEAIEKEEKELLEQEKEKIKEEENKNLDLIKSLEKQNKEQKQIMEEEKKILKEMKLVQQAMEQENQQKEIQKLKAVVQIKEIAKNAIDKIIGSDKENAEQLINPDIQPQHQDNKQPQKINVVNTETVAELNLKKFKQENENNKEQRNVDIKEKKNIEQLQEDNSILQNKFKLNDINHLNPNNNLVPLPIALSSNLSEIYKNIVAKKDSPPIDIKNNIPHQPNAVDTNIKLEVVPAENNGKHFDVNKQAPNILNKKDQLNLFDVLKTRTEKQESVISHREIRSVDETKYLPLSIEVEEFDKKDPEMQMIDINQAVIIDETKDSVLEQSKDSCQKDHNNVNIEKATGIKSTEMPLIKMITKLSEPELVSFKAPDVDNLNIDYILKPFKRDLKSYKATRRK